MQGDQALVLGGGGVAGIAWITGLLAGLAVAGQDVTGADVIIRRRRAVAQGRGGLGRSHGCRPG